MICTRAEVLTHLELTTATDEEIAAVMMQHRLAEADIKAFLGQAIELQTHTEYLPRLDAQVYSGNAYDDAESYAERLSELYVSEFPLRSIVSISEGEINGAGVFVGTPLTTSDYRVAWKRPGFSESGKITRVDAHWPASAGAVEVVYTAGYSPDELNGAAGGLNVSDFKLAVLSAVKDRYDESRGVGAVRSESIEGYSVSFMPAGGGMGGKSGMGGGGAKAKTWQKILSRYKHRFLNLGD
jgi:hypothetical protein